MRLALPVQSQWLVNFQTTGIEGDSRRNSKSEVCGTVCPGQAADRC